LAEALKGDPSAWTGWIRIATGTTTGISCYFNRGLATALSSFPSELPRTLRSEDMKMPGSELRNFLGGELRTALIRDLETARKNRAKIYLALEELNDVELTQALNSLGPLCNLIVGPPSAEMKRRAPVKSLLPDVDHVQVAQVSPPINFAV